MIDTTKCKGFWNMCGCPSCRAADRELEKNLDSGDREKTVTEAIANFKKSCQPKRKIPQ